MVNKKLENDIKQDERERDAVREDFADFVATFGGQIWLRNLINNSGVMSPELFTGNSSTFYRIGMRDVGLSILKEVQEANPDAYAQIMKDI